MPAFIDFSHFTAAKNRFEGNPGLCNLFKFLAIETWKRLEFTYIKPKIKVYETTITQNIAFTINAYANEYPNLLIDVWEADDEKTNGNDLELLIAFTNFGFNFYAPIQAKKVYRDGRYHAMEHGDQIEKLIRYAERLNGYPLYLLYNYVDPIPATLQPDNELYGCSLVDAYHLWGAYYNKRVKRKRDGTSVLAWDIPGFDDLHPTHGFPWHELVCNVSRPYQLYGKLLGISQTLREELPLAQLLETEDDFNKSWGDHPGFIKNQSLSFEGWYKTSNKDIIKGKSQAYFKRLQKDPGIKKDYSFNPQTRIVITIP